jgi:hypothetical protein
VNTEDEISIAHWMYNVSRNRCSCYKGKRQSMIQVRDPESIYQIDGEIQNGTILLMVDVKK